MLDNYNRLSEMKARVTELQEMMNNFVMSDEYEEDELRVYGELHGEWEILTDAIFWLTATDDQVKETANELKKYVEPEIVDGYIKSKGRE